jgi:23S rRNA pseudouridine955/2504/2580 synthase
MNDRYFQSFESGGDDHMRRLDRILNKFLPGLSRGEMYAALRKGKIRLNGKKARGGSRVREGDRINIHKHMIGPVQPSPAVKAPREGKDGKSASILSGLTVREEKDLIFLDKPKGVASHGRHALSEQIKGELLAKTQASLSFRPGPLHRLDRNTSGIITFPKTLFGAQEFSRLLREHLITKYYLGLCRSGPAEEEEWLDQLKRNRTTEKTNPDHEGRAARMTARTITANDTLALCLFSPETGLTHQIRAQSSLHGFPLIGDRKYGGGRTAAGYFLHAAGLRIKDGTDSELRFRPVYASPPQHFYKFLQHNIGPETCDMVLNEVKAFVLRPEALQ